MLAEKMNAHFIFKSLNVSQSRSAESHRRQLTPTTVVAKVKVTVHPVSVRMENKFYQVHYAIQGSYRHFSVHSIVRLEATQREKEHIFF